MHKMSKANRGRSKTSCKLDVASRNGVSPTPADQDSQKKENIQDDEIADCTILQEFVGTSEEPSTKVGLACYKAANADPDRALVVAV